MRTPHFMRTCGLLHMSSRKDLCVSRGASISCDGVAATQRVARLGSFEKKTFNVALYRDHPHIKKHWERGGWVGLWRFAVFFGKLLPPPLQCFFDRPCPPPHHSVFPTDLVSHSRRVGCFPQQTCLVCDTADMSAVGHSRHVCSPPQQT